MNRIAIVTDSCASIPETLIESLNIHVVPYYIHRGSEVLRDLVTIQRDAFYKWLPTAQKLPTTAAPGIGDYLTLYQKLIADGFNQIVSIHMTSKGSAAYQAALDAQQILAETDAETAVEVVDTQNVAMCHGWMVIEAARAALQGMKMDEVMAVIGKMIPITRMIQTADTLKYLYMGGRIGRAKHLMGSLLSIKPLISMENGVVVSVGQARSREKAYQMMVEKVERMVGSMGKIKIAYVHAAACEEAEKIKALVEQRLTSVESWICELSPALGVHTGPGTAGICYFPAPEHTQPNP